MSEQAEVGLVHDYLLVMRGAERTFAEIAACWPAAPIYTTLYSEDGTDRRFRERDVHTSGLQRLPLAQRNFRRALPLYPRAVERLPVGGHDLLISSSSAFAHGIRPAAGAVHVCYCHTPFRYAWHERDRAIAEAPRPLRPLVKRSLERVRRWDLEAAARVTQFVANSELTRERIEATYGRQAAVVPPPVEIDRFSIGTPADYFLVVSELVPHKQVETAIRAAERAGVRLLIVGDGPQRSKLARGAGSKIEFRGRVADGQLAALYAGALATVIAAAEEFGIVAVESQAAGRPVITHTGGAGETVTPETGVVLERREVEDFAEAMSSFDPTAFEPSLARAHAESFGPARFRERLLAEVAAARGLSER